MSTLELSVFLAYSALLLVLSFYGSHRIWMAYLHYRHKYRLPTPAWRFSGTSGLYARPEVKLLLSLLRVVADPGKE